MKTITLVTFLCFQFGILTTGTVDKQIDNRNSDQVKQLKSEVYKNLLDHKAGDWFSAVSDSGTISKGDKAGFWKCPYHNGRMCMEII